MYLYGAWVSGIKYLQKGIFLYVNRLIYVNQKCRPAWKGGVILTKEQLGELILSSESQLYATARSILANEQECGDAIQEAIVKAFSKIHTQMT